MPGEGEERGGNGRDKNMDFGFDSGGWRRNRDEVSWDWKRRVVQQLFWDCSSLLWVVGGWSLFVMLGSLSGCDCGVACTSAVAGWGLLWLRWFCFLRVVRCGGCWRRLDEWDWLTVGVCWGLLRMLVGVAVG
jgi:hypothetical protein